MKNEPLISIVMPAYNCEEFILGSIKSVLSQTYSSWELLVCDDASTDNTLRIIKTVAENEPRIKVLTNIENKGPAVSRNRALEYANGDFVAFLDSDDLWCRNFLHSQYRFLKNLNVRAVFSSYSRVNEQGERVLSDFIAPDRVSYTDVLKSNSIGCLTVLVERSLIGSTRMSEDGIEDINFWLDLLKKGVFFYGNKEVLANYTIRQGSRSRTKLKLIKPQWVTYRKCQELPIYLSFYYILNWAVRGFLKNLK